jgi:hypothetical protein
MTKRILLSIAGTAILSMLSVVSMKSVAVDAINLETKLAADLPNPGTPHFLV